LATWSKIKRVSLMGRCCPTHKRIGMAKENMAGDLAQPKLPKAPESMATLSTTKKTRTEPAKLQTV
jgi:hypothetical protein